MVIYLFFCYREEMFTKLAKQIIWQRCLHPSCIANPNVPVDHLMWLEHCTLQQNTPHIILTSSQLRTFIRVIIIDVKYIINFFFLELVKLTHKTNGYKFLIM